MIDFRMPLRCWCTYENEEKRGSPKTDSPFCKGTGNNETDSEKVDRLAEENRRLGGLAMHAYALWDKEKRRADRYAAKLRELGVDPETL